MGTGEGLIPTRPHATPMPSLDFDSRGIAPSKPERREK
jgi:hypothetical protein